ncbi:hypothetical protein [Luteimonas arsenica]|uniref:hypothetical protein n=1 Tax=Luteimonas arsenica TaxID=1586242 RepID=UPI001055D5B2|nr:hypothetical protein [Luteimonas arsenica]
MRIPATLLTLLLAAGCAPGTGDTAGNAADGDVAAAQPTAEPTADTDAGIPPADGLPGTVPERFRGTWAADAAACASPGHESHLAIRADEIAFHESSGPVTAVDTEGNLLAVTIRLTGEGETWEATHGFELSADGQALVASEGGMARQRCD